MPTLRQRVVSAPGGRGRVRCRTEEERCRDGRDARVGRREGADGVAGERLEFLRSVGRKIRWKVESRVDATFVPRSITVKHDANHPPGGTSVNFLKT